MTNRRNFLKQAALGVGTGASAAAATVAAAATGALATPAIAQGLQRWRLVTSWAKGSAGPGTTADRLAARITAATVIPASG